MLHRYRTPMKAMVFAMFALIITALYGCFYPGAEIQGNGKLAEEDREVLQFESIRLEGKGNMHLKQGSPQSVRIQAEENLLDVLTTEVKNGVLIISSEQRIGKSKPINYYIVLPELKSASVSGAGSILGKSDWRCDDVTLKISGAGDIDMDVEAQQLVVGVSGAGEARLSGSADKLSCRISGAGDLKAIDLKTGESELRLSGAGSSEIWAEQKLDVVISGAGSVRYRGNPTEISKEISGAGTIKSIQ